MTSLNVVIDSRHVRRKGPGEEWWRRISGGRVYQRVGLTYIKLGNWLTDKSRANRKGATGENMSLKTEVKRRSWEKQKLIELVDEPGDCESRRSRQRFGLESKKSGLGLGITGVV